MKRKYHFQSNLKKDQGVNAADEFVHFFERELLAHFGPSTRSSAKSKAEVKKHNNRRRV